MFDEAALGALVDRKRSTVQIMGEWNQQPIIGADDP